MEKLAKEKDAERKAEKVRLAKEKDAEIAEENKNIARNLKELGLDFVGIANATGLEISEIERWK
ncbi:MAG: hypothetical protein LBC74_03295 [Planctomycetaceae bacterium]|jgi:hypothetical protein|nr:hypothetical protein [Planctomycetaceae bacterium]